MEKLYLFFLYRIQGVGGSQAYVSNKTNYLKQNGWDVIIIYAKKDNNNVFFSELEDYINNYYSFLNKPIESMHSKERKKNVMGIYKDFKNHFDIAKPVIVESNYLGASPYAELLAQITNSSHFSFLLDENMLAPPIYMDFFEWKYSMGELWGTGEHSLKDLFRSDRVFLEKIDGKHLYAYSRTLTEKYVDFPFDVSIYDFKICLIGRLNKPFVLPAIIDTIAFANNHSNKRFLFCVIGGEQDEKKELLANLLRPTNNIDYKCTGVITPIPQNWIKTFDVVLATAGAATLACKVGIPTISYCVQNNKPLGILDYTTLSSRDISDTEKFDKSLSELLDMVLLQKYCETHPRLGRDNHITTDEEINEEFDRQIKIALQNENNNDYYDIDKISYSIKANLRYHFSKNKVIKKIYHKIHGK